MEEVMDLLNKMLQNVIIINTGDYPEKDKLESQQIMNSSFDEVIEQTSQETINMLVYKEWKSKKSLK